MFRLLCLGCPFCRLEVNVSCLLWNLLPVGGVALVACQGFLVGGSCVCVLVGGSVSLLSGLLSLCPWSLFSLLLMWFLLMPLVLMKVAVRRRKEAVHLCDSLSLLITKAFTLHSLHHRDFWSANGSWTPPRDNARTRSAARMVCTYARRFSNWVNRKMRSTVEILETHHMREDIKASSCLV